uniref:Uncharacterized protein n=1 Tax=Tanacetum cinerariifolium TaxID=118510 RepID=A0A699GLK2_TANCI|nr:hypothetical protein [Tanacetum cinerariifolium]
MAYTSSSSNFEVSSCSKACLKSYETLKEHYDNLTKDFNKSQFNLGAYKAGLESVEARLEVYKKNEVVFEDDIQILKLDVMFREKAITELRQKFKKAEKERDDLKRYDSQGFDSQVLENQLNDKYNSGEGYHAVSPPYTGNYMPTKPDLIFDDEHVVSESVTSLPGIAKSEVKTSESKLKTGNPQYTLQNQGIFDSGCSRHMTGNKSFLTDYQEINGGFVTFGGSPNEVNTACYVQNRVLVTMPHNKTPYKLLIGRSPNIDFMKPFGCPVTIVNTLDHLGNFEGKTDEGFLVGYSINSKSVREKGLEWLFDIDSLIISMNYKPVTAGNQTYNDADDKDADEVTVKRDKGVSKGSKIDDQKRTDSITQDINTGGPSIDTANTNISSCSLNINTVGSNDPSMPSLEETSIFDVVYDDKEEGAEADRNNLELSTVVSPISTTRVHKDHPKEQIIEDLNLATQTRRMINFFLNKVLWLATLTNREEQITKIIRTAYLLVFSPNKNPKRTIGTKWFFRNKKDERGIVIRNKVRLVAQGYTQEESIDYDEVVAPVARIEAIKLFLAYASFMGFIVYQMDVKSAFLYGTIEELFQYTTREDSLVEVAAPPPKSKPTRGRPKRTDQNEDAPRSSAWKNKEKIMLCKGWVHVSENNAVGNARRESRFWTNVLRAHASEAGDKDYFAMALLDYEAEHGIPFIFVIVRSSFNTEFGDASINLNVDVGDDEEDEVHELPRPMGKKKRKVNGVRYGNEQGTCHGNEERRTLSVFGDQKEGEETREQELAMQQYKQRQKDIMFYMRPYHHLTGDARRHIEETRAGVKVKWNLKY